MDLLRLTGALLVSALAGAAQIPPQQAPLLRGVLLARDGRTGGGEFSVRAAGDEVVRYRFDSKTYVEREERSIEVSELRAGERVEVLSDSVGGLPLRYACTIHVIDAAAPQRPRATPRPPLTLALPPGSMTFSGVVSRLTDGQLVLHTRDAGEQTILLRKDTRFLADGETVPGASLKTNMRVFVQVGKDIFGHVEAYQVVWGDILQPH